VVTDETWTRLITRDMAVTCRANDKDNPTSPGLRASFPNTTKRAEKKMTRSPMNSAHTPIHLQVTDHYIDYLTVASLLLGTTLFSGKFYQIIWTICKSLQNMWHQYSPQNSFEKRWI